MDKKEKVDFKYNLKIYFSIFKNYKSHAFWLILVLLIIEILSFLDKYLFKVVIDNGTSYIENAITINAFTKILITITVIFISAVILRGFLRWGQIHLINVLDSNLIVDLKKKFFNHLIGLSYKFHTTHRTGSLISRLIRGAGSMERMTDLIMFNVFPLIFQLIIAGSSLIYFDAMSAFVILITMIIFISYSLYVQNMQQKAAVEANKLEDFEKGNIGDFFTNVESIKYFGKEKIIKEKFLEMALNTRKAFLKNWHYSRWLDSGQSLILGLGTFALIYFPVSKFLMHEITLGTLTLIYTIYGSLIMSLFGFVYGLREYYRVMADFESLFQYYKIENDVKDKPNAKDLIIKKGIVEFKNISFSYHKRQIFKNFNLRINNNEKAALVGHSGSGKSTLVKLLYRLYDVDNGEINVDHKNINEFKQESLRAELSIVPQECILFDDTIYNNIAFSNPKASRTDIIKAMKNAQLYNFVNSLPDKENTIVGERGVKLSGGEKQRVSIARAILADKRILVLDEATSSLDSKTEHEIQKALKILMKDRTTIIIAHRLSTILNSDRIIVMDNGKIVQIGGHKQLIKKEGIYKGLWNLQKGGYIK